MNLRRTTSSRPNAVVMVVSGMLVSLVTIVFARLAYGLILPPMRDALGLSYRQAGNLGTITALGYLLFVLLGGVAASRWGARKAVIGGLLTVTLGFTGLAFANGYPVIVVLMVLLGIGTAFCFAPMISLLATWYPHRRGLVIGCMGAGVGAGLFLTGLLVPWLSEWLGAQGWRAAWGVFAVIGALVSVLVTLGVYDPPAFDGHHEQAPPAVDKWRIYGNGRVITVAVVYGIVGMIYIIQAIFMVSFAEESGLAPTTAGWLMAMNGLLSVASGPLWGTLSDTWGRGNALLLSMAAVTVAMALPLVDPVFPFFFAHFLIMGCAMNGLFTMVQAASTDQVAPRHIPITFSYVTLFFAGGQFIGPAVAGWLIEASGGFQAAIGFSCAALLGGLCLTLRIRHFPAEVAVS
ncbi:MFS transporter [Alcanivorax sp. N3-2A]|nr:MFS transporter [Alcanivorax sp. N3-2A]|tara:strand:+ start:52165 stop:53379 length:1215 start_codon:yes stop_codon:yes gene_type:complete